MKSSDRAQKSGFTLIEVLATFVLLIAVLPAVAKGISVCAKAQSQARVLVEATTLADSKLAELVAYSGWEGQTFSGDFSPEHPELRWMAASVAQDESLWEVVVVVAWTEAAGERSVSLSTLVYRPSSSTSTSGGTSL